MTITELGISLRSGEISCLELTREYLNRIETQNEQHHAFCNITKERAIEQAKLADKELGADKDRGALHGIPFAVKDHFNVAGEPTTAGCSMLRNNIADDDATAVQKLCQAGMILLGKLHTVQFGGGITGLNHDMGTPRNPWKKDHYTPGGSSSGSGVAVAAGLTPVALGGDTGGSIRVPASLCGIVGLKPTKGQLSGGGVFPMSHTLDTIGPMTRRVKDAALVFQAMQGIDSQDLSTLQARELDVLSGLESGIKGLTLGYGTGCLTEDADTEVVLALENSKAVFKDLGANILDLEVPEFDQVRKMAMRYAISASEVYTTLRRTLGDRIDKLDSVTQWINVGKEISATTYLEILNWRNEMAVSVINTLDDIDGLITPTTLIPAVPLSKIDPADGDGTEDYSGGPCEQFTRNASSGNMLGLCAVSLPCGFSASGLPIGLQIYGKPFNEDRILQIAQAYENATDWHTASPPDYKEIST